MKPSWKIIFLPALPSSKVGRKMIFQGDVYEAYEYYILTESKKS